MNSSYKSEKRILYGKVVKAMDYENNVRVALLSSEKLEALAKQNIIEQETIASANVEQLDFGDSPSSTNTVADTQPAQSPMMDTSSTMSTGTTNKFINLDDKGPTPGEVGPSQLGDAGNPFGLPLSNVGGSDALQVTNPQDLNTLMSTIPTNVETVQQSSNSGSPFAATPIPVSNPIKEEVQLQQGVPSLTDLQMPTKEVLANEPTNTSEDLFSSLSMDKPPVVETQPTTETQPLPALGGTPIPMETPTAMVSSTQLETTQPATTTMVSSTQLETTQPTMVSSTQLEAAQPAMVSSTQVETTPSEEPKEEVVEETEPVKKITDINEYREYVLDKADEYYQKFLDDIEAVLDFEVEQKETLGALPQTETKAQTLDNPLINDAFTHISNISVDPGAPGIAA